MTHEYCRQPAQIQAISVLCLRHVRHVCIMTVIISHSVWGCEHITVKQGCKWLFVKGGHYSKRLTSKCCTVHSEEKSVYISPRDEGSKETWQASELTGKVANVSCLLI